MQNKIKSIGFNTFIDFLSRFVFLTSLSVIMAIFGRPIFGTTDDNILAGFVDGSYTGERESKLIFIRPLIGSILNLIQGVLPNLGIYSLFLLAFLIIGLSNFGTLISSQSRNNNSKRVINSFWVILTTPIISWFTLGPTYTAASMLITLTGLLSLIILIFSKSQKDLYLMTILSTFIFVFGFLIRPEGGMGVILVVIPVIIFILVKQKYISFPKLLISLVGFFIIFGLDSFIQSQLTNSSWSKYDEWNSLRHQIQHRVSQNFLDDFRDTNGWTIPEYHLIMDIAFGDERTFNSEWIKPAFESTAFTRGASGVLGASVLEVIGKLFIIFKTYLYLVVIQLSMILIVLNVLRINFMSKIKIVFASVLPTLGALYYMAATLHIPERGVIPVLFMPTLILLSLIIFYDWKENLKIFKLRIIGLGLIGMSLVAPNGILDICAKNSSNIDLAALAGSELRNFSNSAIYIGPANSEVYEYRNPYTNLAFWNAPIIVTTGNWETFSPHWYKRLQNNGIDQASIYEELFKENRFWFGSQIPDTAYFVELFLREKGKPELSRQGVLDMKSGYVLFKFEQ